MLLVTVTSMSMLRVTFDSCLTMYRTSGLRGAIPIRRCTTIPSSFGDSDFYNIRKNNKFYVDKTSYALELISKPYALLQKPSRLGKTLFINTVKCVYDTRYANEFDELFDGLDAGKNKPAAANTYSVLTINLPSAGHSNGVLYESQFHKCVLSNITTFLTENPHVLEHLGMSLLEFRQEYRGDSNGALESICTVVGNQKFMVLVDEYDRAPMDLYSSLCAANPYPTDITAALEPVTIPLKNFLGKLKSLGTRFYVTGICTVPGMKLSIFNKNKDLTHVKKFVHAFGWVEDDVKMGLRLVAGVKDIKEMQRAVDFLHINANGYMFFGAEKSIFNPQLISEFLDDYVEKNYTKKLQSVSTIKIKHCPQTTCR